MVIISFIVFLLIMTGIGLYSSKKSLKTTADYILANRSVGAIPTALSAVSTCHSGFMFIGMIGFTYTIGLSAIWLIIAWLIGDFFAWTFVYKPLREKTEKLNTNTISQFISHHLTGHKKQLIQKLSAIFIVLFLSVYAAAQLTAGSKALSTMLNWSHTTGIMIGAVIVVAYSVAGGIRASIWTDVAQSILMFVSMIGLFTVAILDINGFSNFFSTLQAIDPTLLHWIPQKTAFGFPLYLAGWIAFGLGVMGQPHIITRTMSISKSSELKKAKYIYFTWYIIFSLTSLGVGLAARILLPELTTSDAELALPMLATKLLPSLFVGGILAGLFSATISTADSQILTCSAAMSQDIFSKYKHNVSIAKITTICSMILTVLIALFGSKSVYILVILGWSGLAVTLGPLILSKCINIKLGFKTSLAMMSISFITIIVWYKLFNLSADINEVLPGISAACLVFILSRLIKQSNKTSS